jgi:predicted phage tail protein
MHPLLSIALGAALLVGPFIPYSIDVTSRTAQGLLFLLFFTAPVGGFLILAGLAGLLAQMVVAVTGKTNDEQSKSAGAGMHNGTKDRVVAANKRDAIKDHLDRIAEDRIAELKRTNRSGD